MEPRIYLNAAGLGTPHADVHDRMLAHLLLEAQLGPHRAAVRAAEETAGVRRSAARLLGAGDDDVGFAATTCSAWLAIATALPLKGRRVLVAPHEWGANVRVLQRLSRQIGFEIERLPDLDLDTPDPGPWQARIDEDVAAIFLPLVTSVSGLRYPLESMGRLDRPADTVIVADAAQALGQIPLEPAASGWDVLVATARKWMRGPRQTALFSIKPRIVEAGLCPPVCELEPFDHSAAGRLGLGVALRRAETAGIESIQADIAALNLAARQGAQTLGLDVMTSPESGTGCLTLLIPSRSAEAVRAALTAEGIVAKWPDPQRDEPLSKVPGDARLLRLAPHVDNRVEEIEQVLAVIGSRLSTRARS